MISVQIPILIYVLLDTAYKPLHKAKSSLWLYEHEVSSSYINMLVYGDSLQRFWQG